MTHHDLIIQKLDEAIALVKKLDLTVQTMTAELKGAADELAEKNKQWPCDVDRIGCNQPQYQYEYSTEEQRWILRLK